MPNTEPKDRPVKKKKAKKGFRLSYSFVLLILMVIVGTITGLFAFKFGQKALEGVNPSPTGVKLPKLTPKSSPSPSPSGTPKKTDATSFLLDENEVIVASQMLFNEQLGGLTRKPRFPRSLIQKPQVTQVTRLASIRDRLGLPRYRELGTFALLKESDLSSAMGRSDRDSSQSSFTSPTTQTTAIVEPDSPSVALFTPPKTNRQTIESLYSPVDPMPTERFPTLPSMPSLQGDNSRQEQLNDLSGYPERALHLRPRDLSR
ncbi:hypothetical protein V2H45_17840 [Tumidithrix elongata RA019]|uniref:Uncharacterized protein n=1 Tax=Tumidithrix elongata BACA0141 TaxID=2716417 RepID=A0AAW9Q6N9_9CYAN|nr:hypothetical protein [Tumidithrix elongata RA019]